MAEIFEVLMIVSFGISWPINKEVEKTFVFLLKC